MINFRTCAISAAALLAGAVIGVPAVAGEVADFYKGKTLTLILSTGVGGSNDRNARVLLDHLTRHLPGKPSYVAKNMPGAGHVRASNYLYNRAPRDGTTIGAFVRFYVLHQALGGKGVKYDAREFNYLGSTGKSNVVVSVWHTAGVTTIAQAKKKEVIVGGTGVGSGTVIFPTILNALLGTKFKIVQGYKSGRTIDLAMERGEVFGRSGNTFESIQAVNPQWLTSGKLKIIAQVGLRKEKGYESIPLVSELVTNKSDRQVINLYSGVVDVGSPIFTNQGVPKARVAALRKAFEITMKSPAYLADAKKARLVIKPTDGATLAKIVRDIINAPQDVIEKAKMAVSRKGLVKCKSFTSAKYCKSKKKRKKKKKS